MPRPIRAHDHARRARAQPRRSRGHAGGAKVWAVLKANAYGHGLERAARALAGADGFAVLDFAGGRAPARGGLRKPILMLEGFFKPRDVERCCANDR